ncbi:hypothetical protein [Nocardioides sp. 503]|uniref:hypothetical protein n=1 Tax=Nocardioides sp. 503 TaxID=2508326 RepID=UPI00106F6EE7|nr:hypothetical protein [Nocardioides sp. 503]
MAPSVADRFLAWRWLLYVVVVVVVAWLLWPDAPQSGDDPDIDDDGALHEWIQLLALAAALVVGAVVALLGELAAHRRAARGRREVTHSL